jgi:hypothetical protein
MPIRQKPLVEVFCALVNLDNAVRADRYTHNAYTRYIFLDPTTPYRRQRHARGTRSRNRGTYCILCHAHGTRPSSPGPFLLFLQRGHGKIVTKWFLQPQNRWCILREALESHGYVFLSYSKVLLVGAVGQDPPTAHIERMSPQELR